MTAGVSALDGRVVVVGAGIAGLATALRLAPRPVVVVSKGPLGAEGSTNWAQGGLAAAVGDGDDPEQHAADTLAAGDGLCDAQVVRRFARAAPAAIERLAAWGARFDRGADGRLELGQEAAHRRRRIVHADGDGSGREVMRALIAAVRRTPSIAVLEGAAARRLVIEDGSIRGVVIAGANGFRRLRRTPSCWRPAASAVSTTSAPIRSAASARGWRSPRAPALRLSTSNSCSFIRPRCRRRRDPRR